jgi:hypothetical protein
MGAFQLFMIRRRGLASPGLATPQRPVVVVPGRLAVTRMRTFAQACQSLVRSLQRVDLRRSALRRQHQNPDVRPLAQSGQIRSRRLGVPTSIRDVDTWQLSAAGSDQRGRCGIRRPQAVHLPRDAEANPLRPNNPFLPQYRYGSIAQCKNAQLTSYMMAGN